MPPAMADAYLNDGAAIARESRRIVEAEADLSGLASRLVEVRGREKPLSVYTLGDGREIALPTGR